jgi:membrane protein implicated in regulation of membrane protease activity
MRAAIRSGRAGFIAFWVATTAGVVAVFLLFFRVWVVAGVLAAVALLGLVAAGQLIRRADSDALQDRKEGAERTTIAIGRALARASGGWSPRSREDRK